VFAVSLAAALIGGAGSALMGTCGPFTDTAADAFCPFVLEIFTLGITTGTTATTYDPTGNVTRLQMAAFLSRSVDGVLNRGSRRAALKQFWNWDFQYATLIPSGGSPFLIESTGPDVWVASYDGTVKRFRGSDAVALGTWTGATNAVGILVAGDTTWITGETSPGSLYYIPLGSSSGAVFAATTTLGNQPLQIATDGRNIWTANAGPPGSVSIYDGFSTVSTVTAGFSGLNGVLFDGAHIWVTDTGAGTLLKLDSGGAILQTVTIGSVPMYPVFDGANIWVPNFASNSVSVVRASTGAVLATLTGNGLAGPKDAAFDGQRILVTDGLTNRVSLWKAADLAAIGSPSIYFTPYGACSDGINFWITGSNAGSIMRF
ncbi:MAG TPA: S-layer homology domain-containing protein, partial [Thermoanaerobaculia bacterium]|nr:S-layer homology domain-containing protein [Thermoanaerobaculia bacterium]